MNLVNDLLLWERQFSVEPELDDDMLSVWEEDHVLQRSGSEAVQQDTGEEDF